jgi:hypothetical protein
MTLAEIFLLIAGGIGMYFLLTPLQRNLERYLVRKLSARYPHPHRPVIDVTEFRPYHPSRKEDRDA